MLIHQLKFNCIFKNSILQHYYLQLQNATIKQQTLQSNIMNIEEKKVINEQTKDLMCVSCKSFYGNEATLKMCSQCYKKHQATLTPKKTESEKVQANVLAVKKEQNNTQEVKKEVNKDRCSTCSRKLKLLGIECRCGLFFCNAHRLPQDHSCTFNHKNMAKQKLTKQVVKVEKGKIQSI